MNQFDDKTPPPGSDVPTDSCTENQRSIEDLASRIVVGAPETSSDSQVDPVSVANVQSVPPPPQLNLPEDLRISWGWLHFLGFVIFGIISFVITQVAAGVYLVSQSHNARLSERDFQQLIVSKPQIPIAANVILFALIIFFLYITLSVMDDLPFWRTLGWRSFVPTSKAPSNPWLYFAGGIALAICVGIASSRLKVPKDLPIEELFKNRTGAFLLMGMAVLIAPLVEETVFRGYLYPLFAKNLGVAPAVVITGVLFGFMHAPQLGWTLGLVTMLITVGIIFTLARARAGTVLASFLLHLGYNSMIAFSAIVSTRGFTQMPPHP
jgi:membrane protease YdiL (CAAX protease family)